MDRNQGVGIGRSHHDRHLSRAETVIIHAIVRVGAISRQGVINAAVTQGNRLTQAHLARGLSLKHSKERKYRQKKHQKNGA